MARFCEVYRGRVVTGTELECTLKSVMPEYIPRYHTSMQVSECTYPRYSYLLGVRD